MTRTCCKTKTDTRRRSSRLRKVTRTTPKKPSGPLRPEDCARTLGNVCTKCQLYPVAPRSKYYSRQDALRCLRCMGRRPDKGKCGVINETGTNRGEFCGNDALLWTGKCKAHSVGGKFEDVTTFSSDEEEDEDEDDYEETEDEEEDDDEDEEEEQEEEEQEEEEQEEEEQEENPPIAQAPTDTQPKKKEQEQPNKPALDMYDLVYTDADGNRVVTKCRFNTLILYDPILKQNVVIK